MIPLLNPNDYIFYKPINYNNAIKEGQIVLAKSPIKKDSIIIRMADKIKENLIDIRGLNETVSIDSRQFGLIESNKVIGIVTNKLSSKGTTN